MAYAYNKVEDYFRKNKQGGQGSLSKGATGAPPPTEAAENLARSAETSDEQGNAAGSSYRAARGADTQAITGRLSSAAQQQATNWQDQAQADANKVTEAGKSTISSTYKPFEAGDVGKAERGETNNLGSQVGYTGKEVTFNPHQVAAPSLDVTQMTSGGISGLQAAIQKGRGGRYTPGMGALDASLFAANRGAVGQLQQNLAGMQQGMREKATELGLTDENLTQEAKTKAEGISGQAKNAIKERIQQLQAAGSLGASNLATSGEAASLSSTQSSLDTLIKDLMAQKQFDPTNETFKTFGDMFRPNTGGYLIDPTKYITSESKDYYVDPTQGETNLFNLLNKDMIGNMGITQGPQKVTSKSYSYDPTKVSARADEIETQWNEDMARLQAEIAAQLNPPPEQPKPIDPRIAAQSNQPQGTLNIPLPPEGSIITPVPATQPPPALKPEQINTLYQYPW